MINFTSTQDGKINPRLAAILANLGIPFFGPLLPLVVWTTHRRGGLPQRHAVQALGFQLVFTAIWLSVVVIESGRSSPNGSVLLTIFSVGFLLQLPQIARACQGRYPHRYIPVLDRLGAGESSVL